MHLKYEVSQVAHARIYHLGRYSKGGKPGYQKTMVCVIKRLDKVQKAPADVFPIVYGLGYCVQSA